MATEKNNRKVSDKALAEMLTKSGGWVSRVAKATGMSQNAIYKRIQRSEMLKTTRDSIENTVLDLAEASLLQAVQNGESWAICFVLKCKGKKRGWIEKHEMSVEHKDAPPPVVLGVIPIDGKEKEPGGKK